MKYTKRETHSNVFEHSEAKLNFYKTYLSKYLSILLLDKYTNTINIYDVFCGVGIYKDGKKGSPIITIEIIKDLLEKYSSKNITLTINDKDKSKVENVTNYIQSNYNNICRLESYNLDALDMFNIVNKKIKYKKGVKNLIFIDPYGYKNIYVQS